MVARRLLILGSKINLFLDRFFYLTTARVVRVAGGVPLTPVNNPLLVVRLRFLRTLLRMNYNVLLNRSIVLLEGVSVLRAVAQVGEQVFVQHEVVRRYLFGNRFFFYFLLRRDLQLQICAVVILRHPSVESIALIFDSGNLRLYIFWNFTTLMPELSLLLIQVFIQSIFQSFHRWKTGVRGKPLVRWLGLEIKLL